MDRYLIPSNSKRSMLIFGMFNPVDLVIFLVGLAITFLLIFINNPEDPIDVLIDVAPAVICFMMVIPVPNQHNIWSLTANIYSYFTRQKSYRWKGWCVDYGEGTKEESK